jgi:hypothetical protein
MVSLYAAILKGPSGYPAFPVELGGVGKLHAAFLTKTAYVAVDEGCVVGNPEFAPNEQPAWRRKRGKRHTLVVRQKLPHKPCPLDGCPMFADFRVHGLNKMGDPDFLYPAPDMTAVRLSVRKAA